MKVGVVTGFIPLPVTHLSVDQYHALGRTMLTACEGVDKAVVMGGPLERLWAYPLCIGLPPANPVPEDRYPSPEVNVLSHIIQHNRTEWAMDAMKLWPEVDTWVWLDYGIAKQGAWRNNLVTEGSIRQFLARLSCMAPLDHIPFPGISEQATVYPTGNNWRFCGSTHIWPKQFLPEIDEAYKHTLRNWLMVHRTVPLDLPIWALVEQQTALPFRWYPAEYDASQLDNLPGEPNDPAL